MIDDIDTRIADYFDYLCSQLGILGDEDKKQVVRRFAELVQEKPRKYESLEDAVKKAYDELFDYTCENYDESLYNLSIRVDLGDGTTVSQDWKDRNRRLKELDN